jgi:hypothetical protein
MVSGELLKALLDGLARIVLKADMLKVLDSFEYMGAASKCKL